MATQDRLPQLLVRCMSPRRPCMQARMCQPIRMLPHAHNSRHPQVKLHQGRAPVRAAWLQPLLCAPYARRVKSARLNWIWFQPSSRRMGMVQMKGFTRVVDCAHGAHTHESIYAGWRRAVLCR